MVRRPISLAFVTHEDGDLIGMLLAIISLIPVSLLIVLGAVFLVRREIHIIFFIVGQVLNELVNKILKDILKAPRPPGLEEEKQGHAMPSSHTQFIFFFAIYFSIMFGQRIFPRWKVFSKVLAWTVSIGVASAVGYSRVYLGYHTVEQVAVGAMLGSALAVCYARAITLLSGRYSHHVTWILDTRIAHLFCLRDSSHVTDVLGLEAAVTRLRRHFPTDQHVIDVLHECVAKLQQHTTACADHGTPVPTPQNTDQNSGRGDGGGTPSRTSTKPSRRK